MDGTSRAILFTGLLALGAPAAAQPMIRGGDQELALHLSPDFESAIGDDLRAEIGYGWFLRDRVAVRAAANYRVMEDLTIEDSDYRMSSLDLIGEYQFPVTARLVPFAGVSVGWARSHFGEVSESAPTWGARGGVKYFLADNVCVLAELGWRMAGAEVFVNDFQLEDTDLTSGIGIRVHF